jgi:hypothetical protein
LYIADSERSTVIFSVISYVCAYGKEVVGVLKLMENERLQLVSQEVKNGVITSV